MTDPTRADTGIVLFAHGARDPEWAKPLRHISATIAARDPALPVRLAFLEFMTPSLADAVATLIHDGITRITLVPLFLAQGGHLKHDLPILLDEIRARHPRVTIQVTEAIGDAPELVTAISERALGRHREHGAASQVASSPRNAAAT
jgi:sirohydrochlorin cobaltochelatase